MLVYLPPALVKAVKRTALEQDTSASYVVEQALRTWFAQEADPARPHAAPRQSPASPTPAPNAAPGGRTSARPE